MVGVIEGVTETDAVTEGVADGEAAIECVGDTEGVTVEVNDGVMEGVDDADGKINDGVKEGVGVKELKGVEVGVKEGTAV